MSQESNTNLLERAAFAIEYWAGTTPSEIIMRLLKVQDYERLHEYLNEVDGIMLNAEYQSA